MLIAINKDPFQHGYVLRFTFLVLRREMLRVHITFKHALVAFWKCSARLFRIIHSPVTQLTEAMNQISQYLFTFYLWAYSGNTLNMTMFHYRTEHLTTSHKIQLFFFHPTDDRDEQLYHLMRWMHRCSLYGFTKCLMNILGILRILGLAQLI